MARDKKRDVRRQLRGKINEAIAAAFPGCIADFCGGVENSRMAKLGHATVGFRVKDARGKHRSNVIWIDPDFDGEVDATWVHSVVGESNR
jgi:hypothetical protein